MRQRIGFLYCLLVTVLLITSLAQAQQKKFAKIGWLGTTSGESASSGGRETLRRELPKLGYVEGKNIAFEYRSAGNKVEQFPALADELVRLKVDVIVAPSTLAVLAAKNATKTIPIVFYDVPDPISLRLTDSLARPSQNITGVSNFGAVLAGKRLEVLKETIPGLSRVAVLWNPEDPASTQQWKESQVPARELALQLYSMEVRSIDKYESALSEALKAGSAAVAVASSSFFNAYQKRIADLAARNRLPSVSNRAEFVTSGGLISYGPDRIELYRRVVAIVDKILKGRKPMDIPVEQPTKFELMINLKTAKQIDVVIPPNVLARADKIIR